MTAETHPCAPRPAGLALPAGTRLICFHKQRTSARLRFVMFPSGLVTPTALAPGAVLDDGPPDAAAPVVAHPSALAAACAAHFGLAREDIGIDLRFAVRGEDRGEPFVVLLAEFLTLDPPFGHAAAVGGAFVAITDARGLGRAEREAMRRAYAHILG